MLLLLQEAHGGCERLQQRVDELSSTARHTALELKSREEALSSTSHEREGLQRQLAALLATHKEVQAEAQVSGNKVRVGIRQRRRCQATRCGWASGRGAGVGQQGAGGHQADLHGSMRTQVRSGQ